MLDAFSGPGRFWRGNLHGHSTVSDGEASAEDVCRRYEAEGYDFICLSDHFMERFGFQIADTKPYRSNAFSTLIGAEIHAPQTSQGQAWHILAVGLPENFPATGAGETGPDLARRAAEAGAFVAIAHPHLSGLTTDDILSIDTAHAIEVYNHTAAIRYGRGFGDVAWDVALQAGRRLGGIAVDDSHFRTGPKAGAMDGFGGWVMVKAEDAAPDTLLAALKAGQYYASTGPTIEDVTRDADTLTVRCSPAAQVIVLGNVGKGQHLDGTAITKAALPLDRFEEGWCRVVVRDREGRQAWTNPLWVND
ncbi:MAG: CehA/McbA family metallohydrolase [Pseudomonadota bacterium]